MADSISRRNFIFCPAGVERHATARVGKARKAQAAGTGGWSN